MAGRNAGEPACRGGGSNGGGDKTAPEGEEWCDPTICSCLQVRAGPLKLS